MSTKPRVHGRKGVELPERWRLARRRVALSCLAAVAVAGYFVGGRAGVDNLDSRWLQARFALREAIEGPRRDPNIVLVTIDDKCYKTWTEPRVFWGAHFAAAIRQITRSGAKVVALDWTQPVSVDARFKVNYDQQWGEALSKAPNPVMAKLFGTDGKYILPAPEILYSLPNAFEDGGASTLGFAETGDKTTNSLWTSFFPEVRTPDGGQETSFAGLIAKKSGLMSQEPVGLRADGSMLIHFASGAGKTGDQNTFESVSMVDVAAATKPDTRWKDKIVIFGETASGSNDQHYVPVSVGISPSGLSEVRLLPGVEIQAHAVATLIENTAIEEPPAMGMWLLSFLLGALGIACFCFWGWGRALLAAIGLAFGWAGISLALFCTQDFALPLFAPLAVLIFGSFLMAGYRALSEERERAQVLTTWGKYQDPRLIEKLLEHPEWRSGHGDERLVTVLFADLKNFTKTVEHLSPDEALQALNRYLSLLSETILHHGGIVDKFLGDGLMAQWGAPAPMDDHADRAVEACLAIEEKILALTADLRGSNQVTFEARLTLHTGLVVAGPLGSEDRLEYTIIGDTVNVTSRLQETAKAMECDFLISESTKELLSLPVVTGKEDEVAIRGRDKPLRVFQVLGLAHEAE